MLATCGGVAFQRESKSCSFPKQLQIIIVFTVVGLGFEEKNILFNILLLKIFAFKIIVLTNSGVATLGTCAGMIKGMLISSTIAKIY